MNAKEELTKLLMESYDRGVKDAKQEALAALEKVVAVTNNTCEKHCEATAFKITIRGLEHEVVKLKAEREWVELTDEDKNDCLVEADPCECLATPEAQELMRCVAAKLRSKNT